MIGSTAVLLLLQFLEPAPLLLSQVFLLLHPAHPIAELVLSENAVHSRLLDFHVISFSKLLGSRVVAGDTSEVFPPILAVWAAIFGFWRWRGRAGWFFLFEDGLLFVYGFGLFRFFLGDRRRCYFFLNFDLACFLLLVFLLPLYLFLECLSLWNFRVGWLRFLELVFLLLNSLFLVAFCGLILFFCENVNHRRHVFDLLLICFHLNWLRREWFEVGWWSGWFGRGEWCFGSIGLFGFGRWSESFGFVEWREVEVDFLFVFVFGESRFFLLGGWCLHLEERVKYVGIGVLLLWLFGRVVEKLGVQELVCHTI